MRTLVTGHLGYVGTILVPWLQNQGHEVVGLDSDLYRQCVYAGDGAGSCPPIKYIAKDIRDVEPADVDGFEAVIHLAGLSNDPLGSLDPRLTHEINHRATVRLAEIARGQGVSRFVFASSCSVYGSGGGDWIDEGSPCGPLTPYGKSKWDAEAGLADLATDTFSPVMLRLATAFGFSTKIRFDVVVNNLTAYAHSTGRILLKSDGAAWRPLIHVQDIAAAFAAAVSATQSDVHNQILNIGQTDQNFQIVDLANLVSEVTGCEIAMVDGAVADHRCYRVNCDLAKTRLPGFQPQWTARRGIEELVAAYRNGSLSVEDFEGPRYQRLAHLQSQMAVGRVDETLRRTSW